MKKIFTRTEFAKHLDVGAAKMSADEELQNKAIDVLAHADKHNWVHQTNWFGEPILNLPQDMFALQEIILKNQTRLSSQVGVAWGGSLLFYSTLFEVLGGKSILGIDIFIPQDLRKRLISRSGII